jgi:tol-pal system protein YbgF
LSRIVYTILIAAVLPVLSGCYGAKMVRGPINSEHAAISADSIRVDQRRILLELAALRRQLEEEREARLRNQAQTGVTLSELDESIRILISRSEDNAQRSTSRPMTYRPPTPLPTPTDTAAAAGDSARVDTMGSGEAAEEMYNAAYLDLTRGNYNLAKQGFQNYLVRYPSGVRVAEVHYYLGECYYSEDRYLEAVGAFQDVVRKFPESRLVPAAYLKSGYCYRQLEEQSLAEKALRTLIDKHPDTEEAKQARVALDELEG